MALPSLQNELLKGTIRLRFGVNPRVLQAAVVAAALAQAQQAMAQNMSDAINQVQRAVAPESGRLQDQFANRAELDRSKRDASAQEGEVVEPRAQEEFPDAEELASREQSQPAQQPQQARPDVDAEAPTEGVRPDEAPTEQMSPEEEGQPSDDEQSVDDEQTEPEEEAATEQDSRPNEEAPTEKDTPNEPEESATPEPEDVAQEAAQGAESAEGAAGAGAEAGAAGAEGAAAAGAAEGAAAGAGGAAASGAAAGAGGAAAGAAAGAAEGAALGPEGAAAGAALGAAGLNVGDLAKGMPGGGMPSLGGMQDDKGAQGLSDTVKDEPGAAGDLAKDKKGAADTASSAKGAADAASTGADAASELSSAAIPGTRMFLWEAMIGMFGDPTLLMLVYIHLHFIGYLIKDYFEIFKVLESFGIPTNKILEKPDPIQWLLGGAVLLIEFLLFFMVLAICVAIIGAFMQAGDAIVGFFGSSTSLFGSAFDWMINIFLSVF